MSLPTVKCPNCGQRVSVPPTPTGQQELRVTCESCGVVLRLQRKLSASWKDGGGGAAQNQPVRIPGYRLMGRLGSGGMGSVFSGVQTASGRLVAIKVLPPSSATNPDLVLRFEREAKMLASLTHPNVVQIIDRGQVGNINYFVMEYIPGRTLKDRLETERIPVREVIDIVARVGEAIQHCHDHGLVHRDLKPGNILLTPAGEVKVTDFGISGLLRRLGDITEQGVLIGTPQYVAPEQLRDGSRIDHRADQFSLAVLAYEMLTNSLPIGVFDPVSKRRKEVPAKVDSVLSRALARDPADRYRSVRELIHEFRKAFQTVLTPPPAKPADREAPPAVAGGVAKTDELVPVASTSPDFPKKIRMPGQAEAESDTQAGTDPLSASTEDTEVFPETTKARQAVHAEVDSDSAEDSLPPAPESEPAAALLTSSRIPSATGLPRAPTREEFGIDLDFDPLATSDGLGPASTPSPSASRGWNGMAAPHRFAVIGVVCLLVVGSGSVFLRQWVSARTASPPPALQDGSPAPEGFQLPIAQQADLMSALEQPACRLFLFADRNSAGHWDVAPDLFASREARTVLKSLPAHLVDASLRSQTPRGWTWKQGCGMVFSACPPGQIPCLVLGIVDPPDPRRMPKAFDVMSQVAASQTFELPPAYALASQDLLANGYFLSPLDTRQEGRGWKVVRLTKRSSVALTSSSRPDATVTSPRDGQESEPLVALDLEGGADPVGLSQTVQVEAGCGYALRMTARAAAEPAWLSIDMAPAQPDPSRKTSGVKSAETRKPGDALEGGGGNGESAGPAKPPSAAWNLGLQLGPRWRAYEIHWTTPNFPPKPEWTLTLRAEKNRTELKNVSLRALER